VLGQEPQGNEATFFEHQKGHWPGWIRLLDDPQRCAMGIDHTGAHQLMDPELAGTSTAAADSSIPRMPFSLRSVHNAFEFARSQRSWNGERARP